jgi:uncharacterized protein involved in outer membrane biogenesis
LNAVSDTAPARHSALWLVFKVLAWIVATLILLIVVAFVLPNWNWLRAPLSSLVHAKTGRELRIGGDLIVRPGWPALSVNGADISFANPDWARGRQMLTVRHATINLSLPSLLCLHIALNRVHLDHTMLDFERSVDDRKSWLLDREQNDDQSQIKIRSLLVTDGQLAYYDPQQSTDIQATIATPLNLNDQTSEPLVFTASGRYKGQPLNATGHGAGVMALRDSDSPYLFKVAGHIGPNAINADGSITNLLKLSKVDIAINLSGGSLAELYSVLGIVLPDTPAYSTHGRLIHYDGVWRYQDFSGTIGKSDIAGSLQVDHRSARPLLTATLNSRLLKLADLGPLVGTSNERSPTQPSGHVLPATPFRTDRWSRMDADVTLTAASIERPAAVPLNRLHTRLLMSDAVLTLEPLQFDVAGGTLSGKVRLDGRQNPIRASADLRVRQLKLAQLFPTLDSSRASVGIINGDIDLQGNGNTVAAMLGDANGNLSLVMGTGRISKLAVEAASLHLLEILQLKLTGDQPITINCGVAGFNVKTGVMHSSILLLDTDISRLQASGTVNLADETLDLELTPRSKKLSLVALRTPIHINGSFRKPDVGIDKGKLALRGLGAVALGVLNPVLALLPLVDTGPGPANQCGKLIAEVSATAVDAKTVTRRHFNAAAPR